MRNSTGSPVFSDFQSDLSRVAVSRPLVKGNEDAGYEGGLTPRVTNDRPPSSAKFANHPTPGTDKAGKCPTVARGGGRGVLRGRSWN